MSAAARPGQASFTRQRTGTALAVKNASADMGENRGKAYVDETTARELLLRAKEAAQAGVMVDIREYLGTRA